MAWLKYTTHLYKLAAFLGLPTGIRVNVVSPAVAEEISARRIIDGY